jgi:predicted O-methyltransferase YrrM
MGMSAAKQQVARLLQWVPMPARTGNNALSRLMAVYAKRPDLQEVFPEAADGDLDRLINWAAGVSTRQFVDGSFTELVPSALWYCAKRKRTQELSAPSPWADAEQTSAATANPLNVTLSVAQEHKASDISHHLFTMALIVTEFKLKNIVELGTRDGNSTLALLEAARSTGGRVRSVDIAPCDEAKSRIRAAGLDDIWSFIQADSLKLDESSLPEEIDLLFIDTSHMYVQTLAELRKYRAWMKEGSWILLHDYVEYPGVRRAVHDFVTELSKQPTFYPFVHQNGLAVIRL